MANNGEGRGPPSPPPGIGEPAVPWIYESTRFCKSFILRSIYRIGVVAPSIHGFYIPICSLFTLRRFVSSYPIFVTTSYIAVHCELDYTDVVSFYSANKGKI